MAKASKAPPTRDGLAELAKTLESESDRAVALIIAAWLDDALAELIKARLVQTPKLIAEMFSPNGPFGTFSARIKTAYLMGLFEKRVFDSIETMRAIRNDFAHLRDDISFKTQAMSARCRNLIIKGFEGSPEEVSRQHKPEPGARTSFVATGLVLTFFLMESADGVTPPKAPDEGQINAFFKKLAEGLKAIQSAAKKPAGS